MMAFGVGEEAVERAGDVAEMEGDGREAGGTREELGFGEGGGPAGDVFGG